LSLADYLAVVEPHLEPVLVGKRQWLRITGLAAELPDCSVAGFECRLGPDQPRVDFSMKLAPGRLALPERFLAHPVWQRLMSFCEKWTEHGRPLNSRASDIWLEFDLQDAVPADPLPIIFLIYRTRTKDDSEIAENLALLWPRPPSEALRGALHSCMMALPEGSAVPAVGLMISRGIGLLRIEVDGLTCSSLSGFLDSVGWSGSSVELARVKDMFSPVVDRMVLGLDLDGTILPSLGLMFYPGERKPEQLSRFAALIRTLVACGLCDPDKAAALSKWEGVNWRAVQRRAWPRSLYWVDRFMQSRAESAICRYISFVKVAVGPQGHFEAKAYLAYRHTWLDRGDLLK